MLQGEAIPLWFFCNALAQSEGTQAVNTDWRSHGVSVRGTGPNAGPRFVIVSNPRGQGCLPDDFKAWKAHEIT